MALPPELPNDTSTSLPTRTNDSRTSSHALWIAVLKTDLRIRW